MSEDQPEADVRATYDEVAADYDAAIGGELAGKPLDRAFLDALAEQSRDGRLVDLGCGPGHVTAYLAERHRDVLGVDLSPEMVRVARERHPGIAFEVASMLDLSGYAGAWAGVAALYSVIHFSAAQRARAFGQIGVALRPGGRLLVAFHVDSAEVAAGGADHLTEWFGHAVTLTGWYLVPEVVAGELEQAGFEVEASTVRLPIPGAEYPSRRAYLLARRD
jgi:SAM-dependent methyltransferase